MRTIFTSMAIAAFATGALAEAMVSGNGEATGTTNNKMIEVAEGHMVIDSSSTYETMAFEGGSPMDGSTGECHGAIEINTGEASGGGNCVYTDADGDKWVIRWIAEGMGGDGALEGSWAMSGGTGKYVGATGGGKFSSLTDQSTGKFVNTVSAEITLP